jgi:hypothetical protein
MKTKNQHTSAQQGASDTTTSVVAVGDGHDANAITIPSRKDRIKMLKRIWKRLDQEVGTGPLFDILGAVADRMLDDLERGNTGKGNPTESDWFAPDGSLTDSGWSYVQEAVDEVISSDLVDWCDTITGLAAVLDKKCLTYFKIERAAEKRARE